MSEGYWIYQIVQYRDGSGFGLHEVFYNGDEEPWGRTDDPEVLRHGPGTEDDPVTAEGLKRKMALMLADAIRHDVLEEPEEWPAAPFQAELDKMKEEYDLVHDARREEEPEVDPDV
ncbi:hypothetical protein KAR91_12720 [Candidatus Pacearchaeota archaeon]|nr:hypothetical protein [Candidatus Pacearchaeota archaeon]